MEGAMMKSFVSCDDKYRNSRFKLIPNVSTGPWIVQSSVGRKPLIVGGALRVIFILTMFRNFEAHQLIFRLIITRMLIILK
mmetsp:Transcript_7236/g.21919  ORF Transcript_7236/g.21919 Transcript_7236/m.21919 type:complete len:81 (-) Transcript_7236:10836-11078(-)